MTELLGEILSKCAAYMDQGKVADYIPELAKANKNEFGICTLTNDGNPCCAGDYANCFTMQSIIKPIILLLALMDNGTEPVRR